MDLWSISIGRKASVDPSFSDLLKDLDFGAVDLTWQAFGGVEYRFAQHWSARAGYRALGIDIDTRETRIDAVLHGPLLGVSYRF